MKTGMSNMVYVKKTIANFDLTSNHVVTTERTIDVGFNFNNTVKYADAENFMSAVKNCDITLTHTKL